MRAAEAAREDRRHDNNYDDLVGITLEQHTRYVHSHTDGKHGAMCTTSRIRNHC
jgi:hypothetical protein